MLYVLLDHAFFLQGVINSKQFGLLISKNSERNHEIRWTINSGSLFIPLVNVVIFHLDPLPHYYPLLLISIYYNNLKIRIKRYS